MKRLFWTALVLLADSVAFAVTPTSENVSLSVAESGKVTIAYDLVGADGVVTLDIQTNATADVWASIGAAHFRSASGDVNVLVTAGEGKKIVWRPHRDWPDRRIDAGDIRAVVTAWAKHDPPDYMVVNLTKTEAPRYYATADDVPLGVGDNLYKTDKLVLRKIPAAGARFRAGSPLCDKPHEGGRETAHMVTLTEDFYLGIYPVTQTQWSNVVGSVRSEPGTAYVGPLRPANRTTSRYVCGYDNGYPTNKTVSSDSFLYKLRERTAVGSFYVPTEAQWEFACRAGTNTHILWGEDVSRIPEFAWCKENSESMLHDVGLKMPNPWGLYDMIGLVEELCADWWVHPDGSETVDPEGSAVAPANLKRAVRGGCYWREATACRAAFVSGADQTSGGDTSNGVRVMCAAQAY